MASYWFKSRQINVNCSRIYESEGRMRAAAIAMLRKRARDANAELYVYSKWGPYSGPEEDSCVGYAAFGHDAETVKWIPAKAYQ